MRDGGRKRERQETELVHALRKIEMRNYNAKRKKAINIKGINSINSF